MRKNLNFDRFCSFAPPGISIRPLTSSHRSTKKILVRRSVRRYVPTSKNLGFDLEKSSGWHLNSTNRFRATRIAYGEHVVLHFPYRIIRSCLFENLFSLRDLNPRGRSWKTNDHSIAFDKKFGKNR